MLRLCSCVSMWRFSNSISKWNLFKFCIDAKNMLFCHQCEVYAIRSSMWQLCVLCINLMLCILRNNMKIMRIEYRFDIYEICVSMWLFWKFVSTWVLWEKFIDVTTMTNMYRCEIYVNLLSIGNYAIFLGVNLMRIVFLCEFDVNCVSKNFSRLFIDVKNTGNYFSLWNLCELFTDVKNIQIVYHYEDYLKCISFWSLREICNEVKYTRIFYRREIYANWV